MKKTKLAAFLLAGILALSSLPITASAENAAASEAYESASAEMAYAASKLAAPKNFKASQRTSDSITLKWSAVKGASAYRVYIYNAKSKSFKEYKTVLKNTCTVYSLTQNKTYKFKVAALVKKNKTYNVQKLSSTLTASTTKSNKLAAPTNIKASPQMTKVTLSWSNVPGADAYRIFMYNSKTKKYETYDSVTATKCDVTGLKMSTTYKFKIAALVYNVTTFEVQTMSKEVAVKTTKATTGGGTSTTINEGEEEPVVSSGKTRATEFRMPSNGQKMLTVLNNCGIANYTRSKDYLDYDTENNTTTYVGDILFHYTLSEIFISFNKNNVIKALTINTPITSAAFNRIEQQLEKDFGKKPNSTINSLFGDSTYKWSIDNKIYITYQYNSKTGNATFSIEYTILN